jgi:multidrug efflux system outer membrane protein
VRGGRALALAAALAAGGCSLAPAYQRPEAPVPQRWPSGEAYAAASGEVAAGLPWRRVITDPGLVTLVERALANNRDLRGAVANLASVHALYRAQRSERIPTVAAGADATFGQSNIGGGAESNRLYRADIGISAFEIDLFGRQRNLSRAAFEEYLATEAGVRSTRISLIAETAAAYASLAASRELLVVARETLESAERTLAVASRLNSAGLASKLDVYQAETVVALARSDVARYITEIAQSKNALELLVGAPVDDSTLPASLASLEQTIDEVPAGLSSEVLLLRPDVVEAEHLLIAAYADIGAARAALFPRISLTAAVGVASDALSSLFSGGFWSVAPAASLPLFGSGDRANVEAREARRDVFLARYEAAIQGAFRDVADALARAGTIDAQLEAQEALVTAAARSYNLAESRFRTGIDSYLNALTAQRTYYDARQSAIATRLDAIINRIGLYRAIGNDPSIGEVRLTRQDPADRSPSP